MRPRALVTRRAELEELIVDRVDQRLERGVKDVARRADRPPRVALAVAEFDEHAHHRGGAAPKDAHAIVEQLEIFDMFLVDAEVLAQGEIERVYWAVALGGRDQSLVADADFDNRLRGRIGDAGEHDLALDFDLIALDVEEIRHAAEHAAREQLKRGVGGLKSIAPCLARLDLIKQALRARILRRGLDAEPLELVDQLLYRAR